MPGIRAICIAHSKVNIIHGPGNGSHYQVETQEALFLDMMEVVLII